MLEDKFTDFVEVSYHELATDTARGTLDFHPLPPGVPLSEAGKTVDGCTSLREVWLDT